MTREPDDRQSARILSALMQAAIGAAALYRPGAGPAIGSDGVSAQSTFVSLGDVRFLLDGHLQAWTGWQRLDDAAARRLCRLLRHRRADLASGQAVTAVVRRLLIGDAIPGCSPVDGDPEMVRVSAGMPLETFVDSALDEIDASRALGQSPRAVALPGAYTAVAALQGDHVRPSRSTELSLLIPDYDASALPEAPAVAAAPPVAQLHPTHSELVDIAARLDAALPGKPYRARRLAIMLSQLQTRTGRPDVFDLAAGPTQVLNARPGRARTSWSKP